MSATVNIAELNPETRARALKQIEETEGTAIIKRSSQLAKLDQARQALAECRTLSEVKKIRDVAEAAKVYAQAAHLGQESQNYAAEIALLAERQAGAMFAELQRAKPKATGGRVRKSKPSLNTRVPLKRRTHRNERHNGGRKSPRFLKSLLRITSNSRKI